MALEPKTNHFRKYTGIPNKPTKARKLGFSMLDEHRNLIITLLSSKSSVTWIARLLHCHPLTIYLWCKKNNISPKELREKCLEENDKI